ncbi:MAG TPA: hypothetical protein VN323_18260, partial [Candidatus Dormibacteraeota bacterium]|nr:hypothetical protein [Candidatus Dormibacteraeota bacterium]
DAGAAINRLMAPVLRQGLPVEEVERLTRAVAMGLHHVYLTTGLLAALTIFLALSLPRGFGPTRRARRG